MLAINNPHNYVEGGQNYPQAIFSVAISSPLGVKVNAFSTLPNYGRVTRW